MKTFIERTLPVAEPYLIKEGDRWSHPLRYERIPGAVVLSVAGFPAMSAFEALQHYIRFLFGYREGRLWAEIYRPGAENLPYAGQKRDEILKATRQAGQELVEHRTILPETKARIEQPISDDFDDYAEMANALVDLYETTFDLQWLEAADLLAGRMVTDFWDEENGGFFYTSASHKNLLARTKPYYDGAVPSGNSTATLVLLRLSEFLDSAEYRKKAEAVLASAANLIRAQGRSPVGFDDGRRNTSGGDMSWRR